MTLFIMIGLVVTILFSTSLSKECSRGKYFDPVTGRCDPCHFVCFEAHIQGTVDECQEKCPNYTDNSMTSGGNHEVKRYMTLGCDEQFYAVVLLGSLLIIESLVVMAHVCYKRLMQNHGGKESSAIYCRRKTHPDLLLQTNAALLQI